MLPQKLSLNNSNKYVSLLNLFIYYTWKNIRKQYKNNTLKITALTWNDEFELLDGSYLVSHIHDYVKKHEILSANPPIHIYINRFDNRLEFKIRYVYKLELQMPETIKYLEAQKTNI